MHPSSNDTTGEAFLVFTALVGTFGLLWTGKIQTWNDFWMIAGILALMMVFYFALLLCRAIFSFMAGDRTFWWEKYRNEWKEKP